MIGFEWIDKQSGAWVVSFGKSELFHWSTGRLSLYIHLPTAAIWIEKFQIRYTNIWPFVLWVKLRKEKKFSYEWICGRLPSPLTKERAFRMVKRK